MIILVLTMLGLCFGSFAGAMVWRIHKQSVVSKKSRKKSTKQYSISRGRSMCEHCEHELSVKDLLPLVSWLLLRGKCRYCKKSIGWTTLLLELVIAGLFVGSYVFWPVEISGTEYVAFIAWLVLLVGFVSLTIYDIKWMLLPNKIIFPLYGVGIVFILARLSQDVSLSSISQTATAILIGGGLFYGLFHLSKGKWIGGGDVKLGFLLGGLAGTAALSLLVLFIASLLGTLFALPFLALKNKSMSTRIPFGPFLLVGCIVVVLFGQSIIDAYLDLTLRSNY